MQLDGDVVHQAYPWLIVRTEDHSFRALDIHLQDGDPLVRELTQNGADVNAKKFRILARLALSDLSRPFHSVSIWGPRKNQARWVGPDGGPQQLHRVAVRRQVATQEREITRIGLDGDDVARGKPREQVRG